MSSPPLRRLQDTIAEALGLSPAAREGVVHAALDRGTRDSVGYWLQLLLAMAIATFGLVLGSTAVVIGAMLVSPLMGPIVELGLGLAVGSPLLVLRSVVRTGVSVVVVVGAAAGFTLLLPFHEVTSEIAARTSPTALDLLIAVCCAIAAAYTQVRPPSDTSATAAGTAIGIALVPPLCVAGYGLGTRSLPLSSGALLLFTANLSAIIVMTTACFVVVGFDGVEVRDREHEVLGRTDRVTVAVRAARVLERVFAARSGAWLRWGMPLLFLGGVYLPLQQALREVSWEVRVRGAIQRRLDALPLRSVGTTLVVKRHTVQLGLVVVGTPAAAADLEHRLELEVATVAGVKPRVEVLAVAEASQLPAPIAPRPEPVVPKPEVSALAARFDEALRTSFPSTATGPVVDSVLTVDPMGIVRVAIAHAGTKLGSVAEEMLAERLGAQLGAKVTVEDVVVGDGHVHGEADTFLADAFTLLSTRDRFNKLHVCLSAPANQLSASAASLLTARLAARPGSHLTTDESFRARLSDEPCPEPRPSLVGDAGAEVSTDAAHD